MATDDGGGMSDGVGMSDGRSADALRGGRVDKSPRGGNRVCEGCGVGAAPPVAGVSRRTERGRESRALAQLFEVVQGMPKSFVTAYGEAWLAGPASQDGRKAQALNRTTSPTRGKRFGANRTLRGDDDRAYAALARADAELRRIGRQLRDDMAGKDREGQRRCSGCGKMLAKNARYCASCGDRVTLHDAASS